MSWPEVVAATADLPGLALSTSYGTPALKVAGKLVLRLRTEDMSLVLFEFGPEERDGLIQSDPALFFFTDHYRAYPIVLARLARLTLPIVRHFVERRWRRVAPRHLVRECDSRPRPD